MTSFFTYRSPTTPAGPGWAEDLGNDSVRLGKIAGISTQAQLGAVDVSSIPIDDPDSDVGHLADGIVGLKQFDWRESDAPSGRRMIFTGYVGTRKYARGDADRGSLAQGPARWIDVSLNDINAFLSFRKLVDGGSSGDASFNRPAETDIERVQALLDIYYLTDTLYDGLVASTGGVNMDANDYTESRPIDVLNDCAQQSGRNFFVFYDEAGTYAGAAGRFALFYDFNSAAVYPSNDPDFRVSNVLSDCDFAAGQFTGPTWPPLMDAELELDPTRIATGASATVGNTHIYRKNLTTANKFAYRDMDADASELKTTTITNARLDRYLSENSTEDPHLTFSLWLPKANVNDWKEGQYAQVRFSHLKTDAIDLATDFVTVRAIRRVVKQAEDTDQFYLVEYECATGQTSTPGSCTTTLAGVETGTTSGFNASQNTNGTSVAVTGSVTPADSDPAIVLAVVASAGFDVPYDHLLSTPTGYSLINGVIGTTGAAGDPDYGDSGVLVTGVYYKSVASASAQTLATTYLKGWGATDWRTLLTAFKTGATSPVQSAFQASTLSSCSFSSPPTPGNIVFALVNVQNEAGGETAPVESGWTAVDELAWSTHGGDGSARRVITLYARCYTEGDGATPDGKTWTWTTGGTSARKFISLSEWAIT